MLAAMALLTSAGAQSQFGSKTPGKKLSFVEQQKLAKLKVYEKQAKSKRIPLEDLCIFTQQLASMLEAGLPLVSALEALQDQVENPVFQIIIRDVRIDISSGTLFSESVRKFPKAFPNLFVSMVEAGEASGGLSQILGKVAVYFEASVNLSKKVTGAMVYPSVVIGVSICLVGVLLVFVIPVFAEMFSSFGKELPAPTQFLINLSNYLGPGLGVVHILVGGFLINFSWTKFTNTPKGRVVNDQIIFRIPVIGPLSQKICLSRFCRTYAILIRSGVPILRALEIVASASGNTYVEDATKNIMRHISQGGQLSECVAEIPYFPPVVKHMAKAGEQTGNVDGMLTKVSDFYDAEIETVVESLTQLMEPIMIVVLGSIIGFIVMAMFLPIFNLASVMGS